MPVTTTTRSARAARPAVSKAASDYSTDTARHRAFAQLLHLTGDQKAQFLAVLARLCDEYNPARRDADIIEAMAVYRWHQSLWASRKNALLADSARAEQSGSEEKLSALRQRYGSFVERDEKLAAWTRWEARSARSFNRARKHYLDQKRCSFC